MRVSGEPGGVMDSLDKILDGIGMPYVKVARTYTRSQIESECDLLDGVLKCFEHVPETVEVWTVYGREHDKDTFLDAVNDLLQEHRKQLGRKGKGRS